MLQNFPNSTLDAAEPAPFINALSLFHLDIVLNPTGMNSSFNMLSLASILYPENDATSKISCNTSFLEAGSTGEYQAIGCELELFMDDYAVAALSSDQQIYTIVSDGSNLIANTSSAMDAHLEVSGFYPSPVSSPHSISFFKTCASGCNGPVYSSVSFSRKFYFYFRSIGANVGSATGVVFVTSGQLNPMSAITAELAFKDTIRSPISLLYVYDQNVKSAEVHCGENVQAGKTIPCSITPDTYVCSDFGTAASSTRQYFEVAVTEKLVDSMTNNIPSSAGQASRPFGVDSVSCHSNLTTIPSKRPIFNFTYIPPAHTYGSITFDVFYKHSLLSSAKNISIVSVYSQPDSSSRFSCLSSTGTLESEFDPYAENFLFNGEALSTTYPLKSNFPIEGTLKNAHLQVVSGQPFRCRIISRFRHDELLTEKSVFSIKFTESLYFKTMAKLPDKKDSVLSSSYSSMKFVDDSTSSIGIANILNPSGKLSSVFEIDITITHPFSDVVIHEQTTGTFIRVMV